MPLTVKEMKKYLAEFADMNDFVGDNLMNMIDEIAEPTTEAEPTIKEKIVSALEEAEEASARCHRYIETARELLDELSDDYDMRRAENA